MKKDNPFIHFVLNRTDGLFYTRRQAETTKQCCPGIPIIPHHQYVDFYQAGYPQRSHVASTIRHSRRRPNGSRAKRKLPCRKRQCRERAIHPLFHKNMYTFILLDQHDGRMWQVQWAIDADQRLVIPINPTQNSTNL